MVAHTQPTRATLRPECAFDRMAKKMIDAIASKDADQAQAFLKAQAEVKPRAMVDGL